MFTKCTGVIIPSRNSPKNLFLTLKFFSVNKIKLFKIIVIDSSDTELKKCIIDICNQFNVDLHFSKASTSRQRNLGLKKLNKHKVEFIMFLDDDLRFYKNSFKIMNSNIRKYKKKYVGFCFNNTHLNKKKTLFEQVKTSSFIEKLGLYSAKNGVVLDNGWQTKIENIKNNLESQWLPTSSSIFKKSAISRKYFDSSFGVYSYLEDLDFSLQINPKRKNCFFIASNAKFIHLKDIVRTSFVFGYYEFINRYKIVNKFHLRKKLFIIMAICKTILNVFSVINNYKNVFKLLGNIAALASLPKYWLLNFKK